MKTKYTSQTFILIILLVLANNMIAQQFPYYTFGDTPSEFTRLQASTGSTNNVEHNSTEGLVLTKDLKNQYAGVYLKNLSFPSSRGFEVEFEFNMSSTNTSFGEGDGFALVIFDSEAAREGNVRMGVKGAGLGYSLRNDGTSSNYPGFSNGYIGIGFDSYGNFKNEMKSPNEWLSGIPSSYFSGTNGARSHVTIRGPFFKNFSGNMNNKKGYPVLYTRSTLDNSGQTTYMLKDGTYQKISLPALSQYMKLINQSQRRLTITDNNYRQATIQFVHGYKNGVDGYYVNVLIRAVNNYTYVEIPIVENFFIDKKGIIKYPELTSSTSARYVEQLHYEIPDLLRIGFTASTGGASQRQSVRNIRVKLPYSPEVREVTLNNISRFESTSFDPLQNSAGYNTNIYDPLNKPIGEKSNLDLTSFRFRRLDIATGQFIPTSDPYEISSDQGTYYFNPQTGVITFVPSSTVTVATERVYFDIKNKKTSVGDDLSADIYRSATSSVTLNFSNSTNKNYIIVNANPIDIN